VPVSDASRKPSFNENPTPALAGAPEAVFAFPKPVPDLEFPKFDILMEKRERC